MSRNDDRVDVAPLTRLSDGRLLAIAQAGNDAAFAVLCARYRYPLYVFCRRRVTDRQLAEDLVQETLLTAWTRLDSCAQWRAWVYVIAHSKCVSHVRSDSARGGQSHHVDLAALNAAHDGRAAAPSCEEVCEGRAAARRLLAAVSRLPPRQLAVVGRRLAGASFGEIAEQCQIPEKLARQAAYDARRRLRVEQENALP
jgi:RNA polymerase sigma-70 factor (ECF subfamily)